MRARVDPEQLRVAADLRQRRGIDAGRVRDDFFQQLAHLERRAVALVVVDVAAGKRGLVQVPGKDLLVSRQRFKPVRVALHHRGVVDLFEQVLSFHQSSIFS